MRQVLSTTQVEQTNVEAKTQTRVRVFNTRSERLYGFITLALLFLFVCLSLYLHAPPAAVSASVAPELFSSGRAMKHVEVISRKTHPVGTVEHAAVRDYILKELSAVGGVESEVQTATGINQAWTGPVRAGTVNNIVARLKGTSPTKTILLAAHYDSTPTSFGASDDGSGVAVLLETLRALRAQQPLKNNVIFLFTDGEESGLLGAEAFTSEHAWAKDVELVLNFEARGYRGPAIMFETSEHNGWLIQEFAKSAPHPVANSLAYEIYRILPNDTDLSVFKKAHYPGLNFAYINGLSHYHTQLDSFQQIDERSLQHQGSYALGLTGHFGQVGLEKREEPNAVYFNILRGWLVHYPGAWVFPLTGLIVLLLIVMAVLELRKKRLTLTGIGLGFLALTLSLGLSIGAVLLVRYLIGKFQGVIEGLPQGETYYGDLYLLGFLLLTVATTSVLYALFSKKISTRNLLFGALLWWAVAMILSSVYLPGASYFFSWPLLFGLVAYLLLPAEPQRLISWKRLLLLNACALPAIILVAPMIYFIFTALTISFLTPVIALTTLLLGLLIPQLSLMARPNRWLLPAATGLPGVIIIIVCATSVGFSAGQPKLNTIFYGLNADTGKAVWASMEQRPDAWTQQFLSNDAKEGTMPEFFQGSSRGAYLQSPAPVASLVAPDIKVFDDRVDGDVRTLRLRVTSPRQAPVMAIYLDSQAEVLRATVNGKQVADNAVPASAARRNQWNMRYYGVPAEGFELVAEIKTTQPLKIRLVDQSYELPQIPGQSFTSRPPDMIPDSISFNNSTMVSKSFTF